MKDNKFEYWKKKLIGFIDDKIKEAEKIEKSFRLGFWLEKANRSHLVPKTITKTNPKTGKTYTAKVWVNPNKENGKKVYRKDSKGARISLGKLRKSLEKCTTSQELMQIVLQNKSRFSDENGRPLPMIQEFSKYVSKLNEDLEAKENESEKHQNRSEAMKGNQNAKKDFTEADKKKAREQLKENAVEMMNVPYDRKEYEKLFPRGEIKTPFENVKLGEHQFERLGEKDAGTRKNLIGAMYQTLKEPCVVLEDVDKQGREAKLYIKSFIGEDKKKYTFAVVVDIEGKPVSVSFGSRKEKQVLNKIKTATRFYYVAADSPTIGTGTEKPLPNDSNVTNNLSNVNKNALEKTRAKGQRQNKSVGLSNDSNVTSKPGSVNGTSMQINETPEDRAQVTKNKAAQKEKPKAEKKESSKVISKADREEMKYIKKQVDYISDALENLTEKNLTDVGISIESIETSFGRLSENFSGKTALKNIIEEIKQDFVKKLQSKKLKNAVNRDYYLNKYKESNGKENTNGRDEKRAFEEHQNRSEAMKGNQNAKKDFTDLENVLTTGNRLEIDSKNAGNVILESGETGKSGFGLKHIIEQRYIKDGKPEDEIVALIHLILEAVRDGEITRENNRNLELSKNGIVAILRKEPNNKGFQWVLTGFDNTETDEVKKEATDAITTVIANNSYTPEFSSFRNQVGAVIASIDNFTTNISNVNTDTTNLSEAMKGNDNAKKYGLTDNKEPAKEFAPSTSTDYDSFTPITENKSIGEGKVQLKYSREVADQLKKLVKNVSKDTFRPYITDVFYSASEGSLVATNGRTMRIVKVGRLEGLEENCFVDVDVSKDSITVSRKDKDPKETPFPNYRRVVPQSQNHKFALDNKALKAKINEMKDSGAVFKKEPQLVFELQGNDIVLDGVKIGECAGKPDFDKFAINYEYIKNALTGNTSYLMANEAEKAMTIATGSTLDVIMPMNKETHYQNYEANRKAHEERRKSVKKSVAAVLEEMMKREQMIKSAVAGVLEELA